MVNRPPKNLCQRNHFKNRMRQRFGLTITKETYKAIIQAIQTNTRQNVTINGHELSMIVSYRREQTNRVSVWVIAFGGVEGEIPVTYDKTRGEMITAHPDLLISHKNK